MRKYVLTFVLLLTGMVFAQNVTVTFQADLGAQVFRGLFTATDSVCVRGSFQADAGDAGGNWQGYMFKLTDPDHDTIYTCTATIAASHAGTAYEFKFVKNGDGWEGVGNRTFTLAASGNQVLPKYWFNDDSAYVVKVATTNTIKFTADLTNIYGSGVGYFDPNRDSIIVAGLDWDGLGTLISGNRKMSPDPLKPKVYKTTLTVKGFLGDSTKWKFRAYPDTNFTNTGWETGQDRWFKYTTDGSTTTLPSLVPSIYPTIGPLTTAVNVLFQVDMNYSPKNKYNNLPIPVNSIDWMGVKGGSVPIGNWSGNWVAADTTAGYLLVMNDAGQNGDLVPGDKIWSRSVTFPALTPGGAIEFKYAAHYPGADTVNAGSSPLDNEGGFGMNHLFMLRSGSTIQLRYKFGDFSGVGVEKDPKVATPEAFELLQNYPNPFNPSTTVSYRIPTDGNVVMTLYNIMGQEIGTLVNEYQKAGGYNVTVNASKLASGTYFYNLRVGNFSATKKMIVLK